MSKIVNKFDAVCAQNADKPAFIFIHKNKVVSKTFSDLYNKVFEVACVLRADGIKENDKILLFARPSYNTYVLAFAALKIGASLIYIDPLTKGENIERALEHYRPDYIAVTNRADCTRLRYSFSRKIKKVIGLDGISEGKSGLYEPYEAPANALAMSMITISTNGGPKIVTRTHDELYRQLQHISKIIKKEDDAVVLTVSHLHVLDNVLRGVTTVLPHFDFEKPDAVAVNKKLQMLSSVPISVMVAPVSFCLKAENVFHHLKAIYSEGSIPSVDDAKEINKKFIKSNNYYIYGIPECHIVSGVKFKQYVSVFEKTGKTMLGQTVQGVKAIIGTDDEILISSSVLHENKAVNGYNEKLIDPDGGLWCSTGSVGALANNVIQYRGRKCAN